MSDQFAQSNFLAQTIAAKQAQSTALLMEIADMRHRYIRQVISDAAVLAGKWIELPDGNGRTIVHALVFSPRLLIPENGDHDYNISLGSVEREYDCWIVVCQDGVGVWERPKSILLVSSRRFCVAPKFCRTAKRRACFPAWRRRR